MRIKIFNQNNYQQRNVGFKGQNANIVIEGLNCTFSDLCGPSRQTVINYIIQRLVHAKLADIGDSIHFIPIKRVVSTENGLRVLAVDKVTNDEVKFAKNPTKRDSILNLAAMQSKPIVLTANKIFPWLQGNIFYTSLSNPLKM